MSCYNCANRGICKEEHITVTEVLWSLGGKCPTFVKRMEDEGIIYSEWFQQINGILESNPEERDYLSEISHLQLEVARLQKERDAIEEDFRKFTWQWATESNGFPCRFCNFNDHDVCRSEKRNKSESPCHGRFFEWRGLTNTNEISSNLETDFGSSKSS